MRRRRREGGTTLVLVSLMLLLMITIAALVIDVNIGYLATQRIQRAADLAAVNAAVWLPDQTSGSNSALATATQVAKLNGATSLTVIYPAPGQVRVGLQTNADYFFAPLFGVANKVLGAGGTATSRGGRIVPIGLRDIPLAPGKQYVYALSDLGVNTLGPADWAALSIGGTGTANFTTRLEDSYSGNYPKGSTNTETGAGYDTAADTGIVNDPSTNNAIFQQASKAPWNDTGKSVYPNLIAGSPRIVTVARIVQPAPGKSTVTINRFGSVYIVDYQIVTIFVGKGKGKMATTTGELTFVWLGDYTATSGDPDRGWFATKGLTALSQ